MRGVANDALRLNDEMIAGDQLVHYVKNPSNATQQQPSLEPSQPLYLTTLSNSRLLKSLLVVHDSFGLVKSFFSGFWPFKPLTD